MIIHWTNKRRTISHGFHVVWLGISYIPVIAVGYPHLYKVTEVGVRFSTELSPRFITEGDDKYVSEVGAKFDEETSHRYIKEN